jgi:phosphotransferase system enzyme I (PtsP)
MLRANAGLNNLRTLLPMISKLAEVYRAVDMLARTHRELLEEGRPSSKPQISVMVETPATVYQISVLPQRMYFLSIWTNNDAVPVGYRQEQRARRQLIQ